MKKRILYIESNTDGTIGGSYYSLLYLIEGLNKELYEPVVLFCQDNVLIPRFKAVAAEVMVVNYEPFGGNSVTYFSDVIKYIPRFFKHIIYKQIRLNKLIRQIKPDLVHLNNDYASNHEWVLVCYLNKIKIIAHDRGNRSPATLQTRMFVRLMDAIICVSDAYLKYVTDQNLKPKKACRIYNGLDFDKMKVKNPKLQREITKEKLGISNDKILIGMVGNIDYWKGQMVFVKAINIIIKKHTNVKAILIGKTALGAEQYELEIREYIKNCGVSNYIDLLGFRDDIPELLNAIDIFVHASVEPEPFGRVILEGMSMSKPIVATNSGGTPEQIVNGESGLLVPMDDEHSMAEAIMTYITDMKKANEYGNNAFIRLNKRFSIKNMVRSIEQVYDEIFMITK